MASLENAGHLASPFNPGVVVLVTLGNPREKFWGAILAITPAGLSLRGMELASFEDAVSMVRTGEPFSPISVFFPMHRVERMELDASEGSIPSLSDRFKAQTGIDASTALTAEMIPGPSGGGR